MRKPRLGIILSVVVLCFKSIRSAPQTHYPSNYYPQHPYPSAPYNSYQNPMTQNTVPTQSPNQTNNSWPQQSAPVNNFYYPQQQDPYLLQQNAPQSVANPPQTNTGPQNFFQQPNYATPFQSQSPYHPSQSSYAHEASQLPTSYSMGHQSPMQHPFQQFPPPVTLPQFPQHNPLIPPAHHHQPAYPPPPHPPPSQIPASFQSPYPGYQAPNNYPTSGYHYDYNMRRDSSPFGAASSLNSYNYPVNYPHFNYPSYDSTTSSPATTTTTKRTTPRPKTTTSTSKPLELELSAEDFFYLMQLQQLFGNKSQTTFDFSSLTKAVKRPSDENESPLFYGGVLDLEQLSKIDNMKDLMAAFKKVSPKDLIRKDEDSESEEEETGVETDGERDSDKRSDAITSISNGKRRKGSSSSGASRSRNAKPKRKKRKKNKRKESDRADHGNEDDDSPDEDDDEADDGNSAADESVEDSEAGDEKIGIGSTPTAAQLQSRLKKKPHRNTVGPITATPSSSTTVSPVAIYPNPYVYSMPYNYPQLQLQYMQQLQAMQQQASQTAALALRQGSQKTSDKFPEEELTASSPNENRNVINVNIADPHKSSSSSSGDGVSYNSDSSSVSSQVASRFPSLRRGSFNSMANSLARKALSSIFHRIFPTMKHLNVKGVAAKGCRDVQSIGSLDSIIMPLGLAVTLHPLLLPLVPFLLLALGSIKAIESATCFVSEYFT